MPERHIMMLMFLSKHLAVNEIVLSLQGTKDNGFLSSTSAFHNESWSTESCSEWPALTWLCPDWVYHWPGTIKLTLQLSCIACQPEISVVLGLSLSLDRIEPILTWYLRMFSDNMHTGWPNKGAPSFFAHHFLSVTDKNIIFYPDIEESILICTSMLLVKRIKALTITRKSHYHMPKYTFNISTWFWYQLSARWQL